MESLQQAAIGWNGVDSLPVELPQSDDAWWGNPGQTYPPYAATLQCASDANLRLFNLAVWTNRLIANQIRLFKQHDAWVRLERDLVVGKPCASSMGIATPMRRSRLDEVSDLFGKQYDQWPDAQIDSKEVEQFSANASGSHDLLAWVQPPSLWPLSMTLPMTLASPSDVSPLPPSLAVPPAHNQEGNELTVDAMMSFLEEPWAMPEEGSAGSVPMRGQVANTNLTDSYNTTWVPPLAAQLPLWMDMPLSSAFGSSPSASADFHQDPRIANTVYVTDVGCATDEGVTEDHHHIEDPEQGDPRNSVSAEADGEGTFSQVLEGMPKSSRRRPHPDPTTGISYRPACKPCFEWMSKGSGCNWTELPNNDPTQCCDRCKFYGLKCHKSVAPSRSSRRVASGRRPKRLPVRAPDGTIYSCVCSGCTGGRYAGICDWTDRARVDGVLDVSKSCSPCARWGIDCHKKPWKSTKGGQFGPEN